MRIRDLILTRIDAFLDRAGMTERAFGVAVAGDHKFVRRLRSGAGVTLTLIEKAEAYMAAGDDGRTVSLSRSVSTTVPRSAGADT